VKARKGKRRVASKEPWRTLVFGSETGRFTREQIDSAVLAVMEEDDRKAVRMRAEQAAASDSSRAVGAVTKSPAKQPRKPSKAP